MDRYGMGFLASQLPKSKKGNLSNLSSSLLLLVSIVVISTIVVIFTIHFLSPLIALPPFFLENSASLFKYCEGKLNLVNKSSDHLVSGDAPS